MFRHRELAAKIATLTEDLEELRSEKNLLLASLAYSGEDAADKFPKDIAAMEKKGIISDRCELNRQIKADNALLRELRGQVKKLAQAVKNTIPALAEAMENLRKNLLLFCYQLGYLRKGKERLNASLNTLRPALTQYNQLAKDI